MRKGNDKQTYELQLWLSHSMQTAFFLYNREFTQPQQRWQREHRLREGEEEHCRAKTCACVLQSAKLYKETTRITSNKALCLCQHHSMNVNSFKSLNEISRRKG